MMVCDECKNYELVVSYRGVIDRLATLLLLRPYLCLRCHKHQYRSLFLAPTHAAHRVASPVPEAQEGDCLGGERPAEANATRCRSTERQLKL